MTPKKPRPALTRPQRQLLIDALRSHEEQVQVKWPGNKGNALARRCEELRRMLAL